MTTRGCNRSAIALRPHKRAQWLIHRFSPSLEHVKTAEIETDYRTSRERDLQWSSALTVT